MDFSQVMSSWQLDLMKSVQCESINLFLLSLDCSLFHNVCAITVVLCSVQRATPDNRETRAFQLCAQFQCVSPSCCHCLLCTRNSCSSFSSTSGATSHPDRANHLPSSIASLSQISFLYICELSMVQQ